MTSVFKPLKSVNSLILVGIMASMGLAATAQTVAPVQPAPSTAAAKAGEHRHDPAKMQERMAKRAAELKAKLAITPAQEGAWSAFTAAMKPAARDNAARPDRAAQRAEFAKLTTPERIDKMRAMRTQRMSEMNAAMDKRGEATKTFYAALNTDQKKVFDSQPMGHGGPRHGHHGQHHKG
ncbi:Spy/CpxP family protein refolding chaperone [Polaromonas sp. SM01]|uniref:Spy/CpxP family protein refolding chaperone n=1 Tax=Polaromonas sp. SM01 TaxID=3085630 RepID=UPI002982AD7B|nr:Spy/CpxP family protein refolding chaperone [Polaromonas sp. SM01]MDW5441271.1 Spy/CpxP family protein refolding chaperone [Polaromonas sp. SM01]